MRRTREDFGVRAGGSPVTVAATPQHDYARGTPNDTSYSFHEHFDYGLLREAPPDSLRYEAWIDGLWHTISFNPFTASMSPITEHRALELIGDGELYGPSDDALYASRTRKRVADGCAHLARNRPPDLTS